MNNPVGVGPSKGKQGTTRGKEKIFDLGGNRTHDHRGQKIFSLPRVVPCLPLLGLTPSKLCHFGRYEEKLKLFWS